MPTSKKPTVALLSPAQQRMMTITNELMAKYPEWCTDHMNGSRPGRCFKQPSGEHLELTHARLRIWAEALVSDNLSWDVEAPQRVGPTECAIANVASVCSYSPSRAYADRTGRGHRARTQRA